MPCYRSIDHIMLRVAAAEPLFDLFSRVFALPVAWPLRQAPFATYGWVHAGNTDLEFWADGTNSDLPAGAQLPLVHGFALEPAGPLPEAMGHAVAAGIACKAARAFETTGPDGEVTTNFTNAVLLDLSGPHCCIFFCEWGANASIYPWPGNATPVQRRARHRQALQGDGGGPLGLLGLQTVRMGTPDLQASQRQWQALSGSPSGEPILLAPGITLELQPADRLEIESLEFGVRSLDAARAFLAGRNLLEADTGEILSVACGGLPIRLVEAPSGGRA